MTQPKFGLLVFPSIALLCLFSASVSAQSILMDFRTIDGDSEVNGYENQIDIESFSWEFARPVDSRPGQVPVPGRFEATEITLAKILDSASAGLSGLLLSGMLEERVTISFLEPSNIPDQLRPYMQVRLCDVYVTSLSTDAGGGELVSETLTLNPRAFTIEYITYADVGLVANREQVSWDFLTGTNSGCSAS